MADFQERLDDIEGLGATVVAGSSDPESGARKTVEDLGLEFDVLYGLDARDASEKIGSYVGKHDGEPHIQPAAFVLRDDGTVEHAVYSSGRVGRLTAADALTILDGL